MTPQNICLNIYYYNIQIYLKVLLFYYQIPTFLGCPTFFWAVLLFFGLSYVIPTFFGAVLLSYFFSEKVLDTLCESIGLLNEDNFTKIAY